MESDVDEESDEEEEEEKDHSQICTKGKHFACDELYLSFCAYSDESDDEFDYEPESFLLSKMGLAESALYEVINDHQTEVKIETFRSAIARVEKYKETRKEVERKLDLQYQRKVNLSLPNGLRGENHETEEEEAFCSLLEVVVMSMVAVQAEVAWRQQRFRGRSADFCR
ncbi:unnamed protein product [Brassica oleracea var. botrytis]